MKRFTAVAFLLTFVTALSLAKEPLKKSAPQASYPGASKNVAIGFNSQLTNLGLTSFSMRYWLTGELGIEGIFGLSWGDDTKILDLGGKALGVLKSEQNMTLYGFGLLGFENSETKIAGTTDTDTETMVGGGIGVEFFLPGLPNLGFGTEIGLKYNSSVKQFGTFADWITNVGVRYYL